MRITSKTAGHTLSVAGHDTFVADENGVFEVPHEVGEELTRFATLWAIDTNPPPEASAPVDAEQAPEVTE